MARSRARTTRRSICLGAATTLVGAFLVVGAAGPAMALDPAVPPDPNPDLVPSCGLDVALILDGSQSITQFGAVDTVRDAANAFLESLVDTDTNAGIVIFNQLAPKAGTSGLALTPVTPASTTAGGAHFDTLAPYDGDGFTNWQAPLNYANTNILAGASNRPDKPDLAVFVTDGEPNTLNNQPPGSPGFPLAVGDAITAANGIKALDAHVLAVGVGQAFQEGGQGPDRRDALEFVSGPDSFGAPFGNQPAFDPATTDALYVEDFEDLEAALTAIATELCGGTLTITKEASTPDAPGVFEPAAGWDFTATPSTTDTSAYTWVLPDTAAAPSKTTTTNDAGQVIFQWDVTNPVSWTPPIGVVETTKPGFTMQEPSCTKQGDAAVTVTGFDAGTGVFTVPVGPTDQVSCLVRNTAIPTPPVDVTIVKTNNPTEDDPVALGDTITYTLTAETATALENLVVSDIMPGNDEDFADSETVTYVDGSAVCSDPCTITFDAGTQTLSADFDAVEAGTYTVTFDVIVATQEAPDGGTDAGEITNQGEVTYVPPDNEVPVTVPSNPVDNPIVQTTLVGDSSASCIADTPFFNFTSTGWFANQPVVLHILNRDQVEIETRALNADANGVVTGPQLWPGFSVDPVTNVKIYPPATNRPIYIFITGSPPTPVVQVAYPPASAKCDAGITLVKSNSPTGTVPFGSTITYTLTVGVPAGGAFNQDGVIVSDYIPGNDPSQPTSGKTTYIPGSANCLDAGVPGISTCTITFNAATQQLTWALGSMRPGDTRQVSFRVTVNQASTAVTVTNIAAVVSDYWPNSPSNPVTNQAVPPGSGRPGLPATGADGLVPVGYAGMLLLTVGMAMRLITRRT